MTLKTTELGSYNANCYLLKDDESGKFLIVDPGFYSGKLERFLKENEVGQLEYILLTHGHMDHICGAAYVKENFGGKIVIGEKDAPFLEEYRFLDGAEDYERAFRKTKADITVCDGDVIDFASHEIKVLHTPGHTMGEVCYIIDDLLFTGDVLFKGAIGRSDFENSNVFLLVQSLRKLASLGGDYRVLCGHGEETTLSQELKHNRFLEKII
ncbi:MAG: MBL fold metallo-hydrolase [Acutalibacteraceae bacterium]|nr:MBL fold metallo-hydrolase [Oscillospiraceae bacterium]